MPHPWECTTQVGCGFEQPGGYGRVPVNLGTRCYIRSILTQSIPWFQGCSRNCCADLIECQANSLGVGKSLEGAQTTPGDSGWGQQVTCGAAPQGSQGQQKENASNSTCCELGFQIAALHTAALQVFMYLNFKYIQMCFSYLPSPPCRSQNNHASPA